MLQNMMEQHKERYGEHHKKHLILDVVLIIVVAILLGVIINNWWFAQKDLINLVEFTVTTNQEKLVNGTGVSFTVQYENVSDQPLRNVQLVLRIPEGLRNATFSTPGYNRATNTYDIGFLPPNAHGSFEVSGRLLGNIGLQEKFLAVFDYTNELGQERQEFFTRSFDLTESVLKSTISIPQKVVANSPFDATVTIQNISDIPFDEVEVEVVSGQHFSYLDEVAPIEGRYSLGILDGGAEKTIQTGGSIFVNNAQEVPLTINIYATDAGKTFLLGQSQHRIAVDFSKFLVRVSSELEKGITPGSENTYTISYTNNEDFSVGEVTIEALLSGEFHNTADFQNKYGSPSRATFSYTNYPELSEIQAGESGSFTVTADTLTSTRYTSADTTDYVIQVQGLATFTEEFSGQKVTVASQPVRIPIQTQPSLTNFALYYTSFGDQIGIGPLPPVAGQYTSYWGIIKLINTHHALNNVRVTATLPEYVEFTHNTNVTDGNNVRILDGNKIEWYIPHVAPLAAYMLRHPRRGLNSGSSQTTPR